MINVPTTGISVLKDLCKALGIEGPVCKIVIEVDAAKVPVVYVKRYLDAPAASAMIGALYAIAVKEVTVADDCSVVVEVAVPSK